MVKFSSRSFRRSLPSTMDSFVGSLTVFSNRSPWARILLLMSVPRDSNPFKKSSHNYRYVCCYVYSLPPCYITPSAVPIYQTECCPVYPVYYTCDLSRVMDFARCRLFAQLGHTFVLSSGDR